jgi:UV excision repair protein RAD23
MAQNPGLIQPLIQQIVASNPAAAQALNENPDLLFRILGEGLEGEDFGGGEGGEGEHQTIAITPEDDAAIQRVSAIASLCLIY